MYHPMLPLMVKLYQDMRIREAEESRQLKLVLAGRPRLRRRIMIRVGRSLVSLGLSLLGHTEPAVSCRGELSPTAAGKSRV